MKIKQVLSILLLSAGIASADASTLPSAGENNSPKDSIILADSVGKTYSTAPDVKKKKFVRPQRIDREIMKTVFIPKGQWMAGGTVSYSEHDEDNLNFLVLKNVQGLGYTFNVSPYVGYFFKDNVSAGMRFGYNRTYLDLDNFELNLGEDFNINLKNLYWLEHQYDVSGFLRTYMPIGKSKIFGLFNEVRLTYGYSTGKNSTGSGTEYDGTFERTHSLQIGIAPGMAAFITDYSAVEVSVGVMGYNFKWQKQVTNQIETGKRRTSSGNFKINLFSINIGMTFYL
ncbi:hypothetical protein [Bacteroides helcogenes]|uniref:Outer membrane protein beta-barrel domain-containing protein n=1 Tax=Bacteroides helcogenes (strain ATCC 35417 / DSM 20613 / JCM 6297 / CCUG 15421 / P 36-108) TaxID=693979 RepID=E6SSD5_BACT6|nr:hypothetical protein [Bacteroides helcogenes]ADV45186.1 hypothetical protein Bache_3263 [Bacteroides helcogenes P 36-108]MDY5238747.1 hypothetical protein [Bacteroides helcogenes]